MQALILFLQVSGLTSGRAAALLPAAFGLISLVIGCLALRKSAGGNGPKKYKPVMALVLASIGIALSVRHLARATGDIGTGSGRLGAIVALVLALTGAILGGLALARTKRLHH